VADLTPADNTEGVPAIIIDATLASQFFANKNPIGRRIRFRRLDSTEPWLNILGVTGEVKHYGLDREVRPGFYRPHRQEPVARLSAVVRTTAGDPLRVLPAARQTVRALGSNLALFRPRSMVEIVRRSFWQHVFFGPLFAAFSVLAIVPAGVGVAGAVAYSVAQRTHEARPPDRPRSGPSRLDLGLTFRPAGLIS
jgi:hypothetical protein